MICNKCGNSLPDDSAFCQYCGKRIEALEPMQEETVSIAVAEAKEADLPIRESIAPADGATPKQPAGEVILPPPVIEHTQPDKAPETVTDAEPQKTTAATCPDPQRKHDRKRRERIVAADETAGKEKKRKQPKKKYCSRCGSLIDQRSKKCTGCGKQYFKGIRLNKFSVTVTALVLVIAALIGLNIFQYQLNSGNEEALHRKNIRIESLEVKNGNLETEIKKLTSDNKVLEDKVAELREDVQEQAVSLSVKNQAVIRMQAEQEEYYPLVQFCKNHVAIIAKDGIKVYHKYGCEYLDTTKGFVILDTETAKSKGYTKCYYCR